MITRRDFLSTSALGTASLAVGASARSYGQILGANDRLNFAVIGLNSRAYAHLSALKSNRAQARIGYVCDVDSAILAKFAAATTEAMGVAPVSERDFRNVLARKDVDAITIATPDHWHTPMAIDAVEAGKHVYVEKPCSHNPAEGVLLIEAQRKYNRVIQMGTQQRSSPHTIAIVDKIHNGLIGRAYFGKAWYANTRGSIDHGVPVPVPPTLDWDLWQGPAPRQPYTSNIQPYNWHWFRTYGTGEALNNGTHEVDVCRWALDVGYPQKIAAQGGRYAFHDDWQFYDTLDVSFTYPEHMITWEGRSCNGGRLFGRDRGAVIYGTTGSVIVDRDGYEVYDLHGKMTDSFKVGKQTSSADLVGADSMTDAHVGNFIDAVKTGAPQRTPISVGNVAVTMLQVANIAWELGRELNTSPTDCRILNDPEAMQSWGRTYQPGWEPHL